MDAASLPRLLGRRLRISALIAGTIGLAATLAAAAAPPAPVTNIGGELLGVSAVSASDAWAAGINGTRGADDLMMHWNGSHWARVTIPDKTANLDGVSADSASDAWAVGYGTAGANTVNVALHWNGTSWAKVPVPNPGKHHVAYLEGVSAIAPGDAWAVGSYNTDRGPTETANLALHWNGTAWTQVALPQPARDNALAVTALSPSDAWAVGEYFGPQFSQDVLVLHWNGTSWARIPTPKISGYLTAVSARSASDVVAVGSCCGPNFNKSLVLRWNGTAWTRQASPSPSSTGAASFNKLEGVTVLSATDAWAVGYYGRTTKHASVGKPFILHWNGTSWAQAAAPSFGASSGLDSVAALSPTDVWATGGVPDTAPIGNTLILHWNGSAWTRS
jgi:hypothetical protein